MSKVFLLPVLFLLLISIADGFSVTSFYYKDSPLTGLEPGELKQISIILSNPAEEPVRIKVSFMEGGEIAKFPDGEIYDLSAHDKKDVPIEIKIPENAAEGDSYEISILSDSISAGAGEGSVQFSPNYVTAFSVFVGEEEPTFQEEKEQISNENENPVPDASNEKSKVENIFTIFYIILVFMIIGIFVLIVIMVRRKGYSEASQQGYEVGNF